MHYQLTLKSENVKVGPIPVSTSDSSTCPNTCPLIKKGCYAKTGPLRIHWDKVSQGIRGISWSNFLSKIKALPSGQLWRANQAGDLPGKGNRLNVTQLRQLVAANSGKRGFTYTHKPLFHRGEKLAIKEANEKGLTINLSANTLTDADKKMKLDIAPVVVVVASHETMPKKTADGHALVPCLAQKHESMTCEKCQLCAKQRKSIVAFAAHGTSKNHVINVVNTI